MSSRLNGTLVIYFHKKQFVTISFTQPQNHLYLKTIQEMFKKMIGFNMYFCIKRGVFNTRSPSCEKGVLTPLPSHLPFQKDKLCNSSSCRS